MTKPVSLSDDAYRRLKERKGHGESFSDVVVRLTGGERKRSPLEFAGVWADIDDATFRRMKEAMNEFRRSKSRRF
ncbi:MAG: antitoxin VapB family protein [Candidatus Aenigmatarchaeota archaeon]|nr:MAG: antitoxin VapB family protein [Candidatus Aenigmarchaeota archaeon]